MADSTSSKTQVFYTPHNNTKNTTNKNKTPLMFNMNDNAPPAIRAPSASTASHTVANRLTKLGATITTTRRKAKVVHPPPSINTEVLGDGGYGLALRPAIMRPVVGKNYKSLPANNITKLYYRNNSRNNALQLSQRVQNIIGSSENFRVNAYTDPISSRNLPPAVAQRIKNRNPRVYQTKRTYKMTRQPFLGFSLDKLTYHATSSESKQKLINDIRTIPLYVLFQQIYKLYSQVLALNMGGYVHADLHPGNIMIHPEKQTMTMIDFDLLNTFEDFYDKFQAEFGRAIWPIELAMEPFIGSSYRRGNGSEQSRYARDNLYFFEPLWNGFGITDDHQLDGIIDRFYDSNQAFVDELIDDTYEGNQHVAAIDGIIPHIDMYSLSLSIMSFLTTILGNGFIQSVSIPQMVSVILAAYPAESKPDAMAQLIMDVRKNIMSSCSLEASSRTMPNEVVDSIKEAIDTYATRGGKKKTKTRRAKKRASN